MAFKAWYLYIILIGPALNFRVSIKYVFSNSLITEVLLRSSPARHHFEISPLGRTQLQKTANCCPNGKASYV
jgi:hypothetical protein